MESRNRCKLDDVKLDELWRRLKSKSKYQPIPTNPDIDLKEIVITSDNQKSNSDNSLNKLSDELIDYVMEYLNTSSMLNLRLVCKRANDVALMKFFSVPITNSDLDINLDAEVRTKKQNIRQARKFISYYNNEVNPYATYKDTFRSTIYKYLGSKLLGDDWGPGQLTMGFMAAGLIILSVIFHLLPSTLQEANSKKGDSSKVTPSESEVATVEMEVKLTFACLVLGFAVLMTCGLSNYLHSKKSDYEKSIQDRLDYADKLRNAADPRIRSELPKFTRR